MILALKEKYEPTWPDIPRENIYKERYEYMERLVTGKTHYPRKRLTNSWPNRTGSMVFNLTNYAEKWYKCCVLAKSRTRDWKPGTQQIDHISFSGMCGEGESPAILLRLSSNPIHAAFLFGSNEAAQYSINRSFVMKRFKKAIATFLLPFAETICINLPITNFTNRLIDKLVVMSEVY